MRKNLTLLLIATAGLALTSGCAREGNAARSFYSEAGAEIETNAFGSANTHNMQMMMSGQDIAVNLTRRFASEAQNTVNFAFNSAVLDGEAQAALQTQAAWISQFPEIRFRVYGHTDLVGSDAYNKALGLRRAQAVVAYLVSQGISRSRLEAVASFGKTQPLVYTQGPERRNRRTVTEVSGFVKGSGLVLNGKYAKVIWDKYIESAQPPHQQAEVTAGNAAAGSGG